ncbi:putative DNA-directed RNA polymerase III subunit [Scheffersomyces amazonensis]|uniref:putative DNA-directed RNA polymerase III subunit n=1 Tax=Scheffersomyces amazonensis TaxID=1078765 RepID=UPI00315DD7E1
MKILEERQSFLSNYEVEQHLKDIKRKYNWTFNEKDEEELQKDKRKNKKRFDACGVNLEVITRDVLAYLRNGPPSIIDTTSNFKELGIFLNQFELMKVEKLQIINTLPRSMVILYSLVEECDQRFSEEICESIIEKIDQLFPLEETEEAEDQDQEEAEDEDQEDGQDDDNME